MSIRDILVQVDERGTSAARCTLAAALAREWGAALTGVYLRTPYPSDVFAAERLAYLPRSAAEALKSQHDLTAKHAVEALNLEKGPGSQDAEAMQLLADRPKEHWTWKVYQKRKSTKPSA